MGAIIAPMRRVEGWGEVGARVREARLSLCLSQAELGRRLHLDRTMVAKIEAGTRQLDALELFRLSDALELPINHFLYRPPEAIVSRRMALTEDTDNDVSRDSYRLEARLTAWLRDIEQLVGLGVLDVAAPAGLVLTASDTQSAQESAGRVRRWLKLGPEPLGSMVNVCERLGLLVLVSELPGDGACVQWNSIGAAVVSHRGDPGRRRATAAHELGHFLLGDEYSSDIGVHASRAQREQVIDAFAAELLVPRASLASTWPREHVDKAATRAHAVRQSARYRVSWSLLLKQLENAQLIDSKLHLAWRNNPPTRAELMDAAGWEPRPDLELGQVPPCFAHGVLLAWRRGHISASRAVELLRGRVGPEDLPPRDDEVEIP